MAPDNETGSVRSKIRAVMFRTTAALLALVVTAMAGLLLLYGYLGVQANKVGPAFVANTQTRQAMTDAESAIRGYQLTQDRDFLEPYEASRAPLRRAQADLERVLRDDEPLLRLAGRQERAVETWTETYAMPVASGTGAAGAEAPSQAEAKVTFDRFRAVNKELGDELAARRSEVLDHSKRVVELAVLALLLVGVAGGVLGLTPALRAVRGLAPPLEDLHATVTRLRSGDLTARADTGQGVIEIRTVSMAVNDLAETNERQRYQLAEEIRLATAVREIAHKIGGTLDLEDVTDYSAEAVAAAFGARALWLRVFAGEGEATGRGLGARFPASLDLVPPASIVNLGERMGRFCWDEQRELLLSPTVRPPHLPSETVSDAELDGVLDFVRRGGASSMLFVPVGAGPECLGYVVITRSAEDPDWTEVEVDAALRVGHDVGRAVLHARLFEREQEVVRELTSLDAQKNVFVSTVSHELRTPLASIIGHLEVIRSGDLGPVDPTIDRSLATIERNSVRLDGLIEDLLLLSKIEERPDPATKASVDLHDLAGEVVKTLAPMAERQQVTITLGSIPGARVLGDPLELERVLNNLVGNAVKFSPSGTEVALSIEGFDDKIVIRVRDRGMGISEEDLENLFTRFFRSTNPAALEIPGTGLGLAIVKIIVERHNGTITVSSRLGTGTEFVVTLPDADQRTVVR